MAQIMIEVDFMTRIGLKDTIQTKRILAISDLDGTLLNNEKKISSYTQQALNRLIDKGLFFSVATARTAETVRKLIENIHVNAPIILMNGVCIYDLQKKEYINVERMDRQAVEELIRVIHENNLSGFLYSIHENQLSTYYENTDSPHAEEFIKERKEGFGKVFTKVHSFTDCPHNNIVYYSIADTKENLEKAFEKIQRIEGLRSEFYRDTYHEGFWYLEVCSEKASKRHSAEILRRYGNFETVLGFGDNLNDLSLFEACDRSYAVMNAKDEVKEKAFEVIQSNQQDGVVKYLEELFQAENGGDMK